MISSDAISQLYKKYLGREANSQEIQNLTTGIWNMGKPNQLYDTPEKLSTLLQSTAQSTKNKALQNIDSNIANLKGGTSLFGGQLPDYQTYLNQNPQYQQANQALDQSLGGYNDVSQRAAVAPSKTKDELRAGSALFGETTESLMAKYSDPKSPYYISDPEMRASVVRQADNQRYDIMTDIVGKVTDAYQLLTTASANQLSANKDKVDLISKSMEKSYDALMSYYGQQMADKTQRERDLKLHEYSMEETRLSKSLGGSNTTQKATQAFNDDVATQVKSVLTGQYGKEYSRELALANLTAMYPDREGEIKDLIYGKAIGQRMDGSEIRTGGLLPDGYEKRIVETKKLYGTADPDNPSSELVADFNENLQKGMTRQQAYSTYPEISHKWIDDYYTQ